MHKILVLTVCWNPNSFDKRNEDTVKPWGSCKSHRRFHRLVRNDQWFYSPARIPSRGFTSSITSKSSTKLTKQDFVCLEASRVVKGPSRLNSYDVWPSDWLSDSVWCNGICFRFMWVERKKREKQVLIWNDVFGWASKTASFQSLTSLRREDVLLYLQTAFKILLR